MYVCIIQQPYKISIDAWMYFYKFKSDMSVVSGTYKS